MLYLDVKILKLRLELVQIKLWQIWIEAQLRFYKSFR
jgi:hypothetical protein